MQVFESSLGLDWHLQDRFMVSAEGFFKRYSRMPLSLQDNIPLACKGNDYGVTGNEALAPTASGRPTDWKPCSAGRHPASSISYPPSPYTAANTATVQMETSFHLPGTTVSYST